MELKANSEKRSKEFALKVIQAAKEFETDLPNKTIIHQLLRSATSVGANIAEAQSSPSRKDFTNYFHHALKSANESKYWLDLLIESNESKGASLRPLFNEAEQLAKILAASILTLKNET